MAALREDVGHCILAVGQLQRLMQPAAQDIQLEHDLRHRASRRLRQMLRQLQQRLQPLLHLLFQRRCCQPSLQVANLGMKLFDERRGMFGRLRHRRLEIGQQSPSFASFGATIKSE